MVAFGTKQHLGGMHLLAARTPVASRMRRQGVTPASQLGVCATSGPRCALSSHMSDRLQRSEFSAPGVPAGERTVARASRERGPTRVPWLAHRACQGLLQLAGAAGGALGRPRCAARVRSCTWWRLAPPQAAQSLAWQSEARWRASQRPAASPSLPAAARPQGWR